MAGADPSSKGPGSRMADQPIFMPAPVYSLPGGGNFPSHGGVQSYPGTYMFGYPQHALAVPVQPPPQSTCCGAGKHADLHVSSNCR